MRFADLVVKFSSEGVDKVTRDVNSIEDSLNDVTNAATRSAKALTNNFGKLKNISIATANMQSFGSTSNSALNVANSSTNNYKNSLLDLIQTIRLTGLTSDKTSKNLGAMFSSFSFDKQSDIFKKLKKQGDRLKYQEYRFIQRAQREQPDMSFMDLLRLSKYKHRDKINAIDDKTLEMQDRFRAKMKKNADGMSGFDLEAQGALSALSSFGSAASGILIVGAAIATVTAAVYKMNAEIIRTTVQAAFNFEELRGRLKALSGDAKATDILSFVRRLAEPSNFTTEQLANSAVNLEAFGLNAKRILPTIAQLGMAFGADAEKLRLLTDMFGRLSQGQLPDVQVMAQFGLSKSKLMKEGIKFDSQGSLVSSTREVFKAIEKIVNEQYGKIFTQMATTGNAKLASVTDAFDTLKIKIGESLMDASKNALGHLTNLLTAIERTGIMEKVAQSMLIPFQALANVFMGKDKSLLNLQTTMANWAGGLLAIFEEINIQTGLFVEQLARGVQLAVAFQGGQAFKVAELLPEMLKGFRGQFAPNRVTEKGKDYSMAILGQMRYAGPGTDINKLIDESKKTDFGKLEDLLKPEKDKDKKDKERSQRTLDLIQQNTKTQNEITLRNLTYGGGQLAAQGISAVQMSGNRTVSSPQISASNDIVRGIEKIVRGYNNSNNLNFSFRRS